MTVSTITGKVIMQAGDEIILKPGFSATSGSNVSFEAVISNCTSFCDKSEFGFSGARHVGNPFEKMENSATGEGLRSSTAYPNPFSNVTSIRFKVQQEGHVLLSVYNASGEMMARLMDENERGESVRIVRFDASELAPGVYYYVLQTPTYSDINKLVVIR